MKRILTFALLLFISIGGFSQVDLDYSVTPKAQATGMSIRGMSPETAHFLSLCRQADTLKDRAARKAAKEQLRARYGIQRGKVSAIIELSDGHTSRELKAYGVSVGSAAGNLVTAMIPVKHFVELVESGICSNIDVGHKMTTLLDNIRDNLGIDRIHLGLNLPQGFDGSGVVVGVIDVGFQFCHPSFYDSTGTILRVKRVWNQMDTLGTAPAGYNYGSEYTTESQMRAVFTDDSTEAHGTHVAGTAAGCGAPFGDGTQYKGIAPGADLVFVPTLLTDPSILDGIQYIYNYAHSVGKPCVINMSFGATTGPHDGTSLADRFLTSFVEEHPDSIAFVCSAGNTGKNKIHVMKQFSPTDTLMVTELEKDFVMSLNPEYEVDIWNEQNFRVGLTLFNLITNTQEDFTGFFSTGTDTLIEAFLVTNNNDSLRFEFTLSGRNPYNNAYNANIITRGDQDMYMRKLFLTVSCDTVSTVHAWSSNIKFRQNSLVTNSMEGDSQYSVGGFGANTNVVTAVGSYITRLGFTTYDGIFYSPTDTVMGGISSFSSKGPSRDGRVKPDITAPGEVIVAPFNRSAYFSFGNGLYDTIHWNGQIENYGTMSGTSMSAPVMTGVVALWMQNNPSLRTDSLCEIVHRTARNDQFTGYSANNVWGYGKVNAFGGLPAPDTALWLVNAFPVEDGFGTITGGGVVTEGLHTLTAVPNSQYRFVRWSDGVTNNPRTVYITSDTTFMASFEAYNFEDCDTIRVFPWTAEFDENLTCWKLIDADGDGDCWKKLPASICSMAHDHTNLDNWIVSTAIEINASLMAKVSMNALSPLGTQDCSLLLSTSGSDMDDFTTVLTQYTTSGIENFELTASLSQYQGQVVRLAVRHYNITGSVISAFLNNFTIEADSTSVSSYVLPDLVVSSYGLNINIHNAEGRALQIYDITGRLVTCSASANGTFQVPNSGLYILRVEGFRPKKVMLVG